MIRYIIDTLRNEISQLKSTIQECDESNEIKREADMKLVYTQVSIKFIHYTFYIKLYKIISYNIYIMLI